MAGRSGRGDFQQPAAPAGALREDLQLGRDPGGAEPRCAGAGLGKEPTEWAWPEEGVICMWEWLEEEVWEWLVVWAWPEEERGVVGYAAVSEGGGGRG